MKNRVIIERETNAINFYVTYARRPISYEDNSSGSNRLFLIVAIALVGLILIGVLGLGGVLYFQTLNAQEAANVPTNTPLPPTPVPTETPTLVPPTNTPIPPPTDTPTPVISNSGQQVAAEEPAAPDESGSESGEQAPAEQATEEPVIEEESDEQAPAEQATDEPVIEEETVEEEAPPDEGDPAPEEGGEEQSATPTAVPIDEDTSEDGSGDATQTPVVAATSTPLATTTPTPASVAPQMPESGGTPDEGGSMVLLWVALGVLLLLGAGIFSARSRTYR